MDLISFIVPAHNESFEIGATLGSIFDAAHAMGVPFEVIVVNDASTDSTAAVARDAGVIPTLLSHFHHGYAATSTWKFPGS